MKPAAISMLVVLALAITGQEAASSPIVDRRPVVKTFVSPNVMGRIQRARAAITFAKRAIPKAGNQRPVVHATQGNALMRALVARDVTPAFNIRSTGVAAAVACTRGGTCLDYADVAKHYLEIQDVEREFYVATVKGSDHAFVWIGAKDAPDDEVVIVDPWVQQAEPVLWKDFWVHADRSNVVFFVGKQGGAEQRAARRALSKQLARQHGDTFKQLPTGRMSPADIQAYDAYLWDEQFAARAIKREFVTAPE